MTALAALPCSPPWVLGVLGWRARAVPVISFEALLTGAPAEQGARAKVVVFYPMPGRSRGEFFGLVSTREPQPRVLSESGDLVKSPAGAVDSPYIGATVKLGEKTLLIPDLDVLRKAFYP